MRKSHSTVLGSVLAGSLIAAACSSDNPAPFVGDSGGTSGTGGKGTAGASGKGGTTGTGGTGTAGKSGTAGTAGKGGAGGTGGGNVAGESGAAGDSAGGAAGDNGTGGGGGTGGACTVPYTGVLFSFDTPGSQNGWGTSHGNASASLGDTNILRSSTVGHSCPGSLALTVPFSAYAADNKAQTALYGAFDWTGKVKLHVWVRVQDPGFGTLGYLNGLQLFVQSSTNVTKDDYHNYTGLFINASTFEDFGWHEIVFDLIALTNNPPVIINAVNDYGLQVQARETAPDGGSAPVTTVVYIDDIWLEAAAAGGAGGAGGTAGTAGIGGTGGTGGIAGIGGVGGIGGLGGTGGTGG